MISGACARPASEARPYKIPVCAGEGELELVAIHGHGAGRTGGPEGTGYVQDRCPGSDDTIGREQVIGVPLHFA